METKSGITIRPYESGDWPIVLTWWHCSGEIAPVEGMMPADSSFVVEIDGVRSLAVALYLTNTKEVAYVENFIGNPWMDPECRREASKLLSHHVAGFARARGYKRILCMTEKPALARHYASLGFTPTLEGVTTLVRSL